MVVAMVCALITFPSPLFGAGLTLKGVYSYNGTRVCVHTIQDGFTDSPELALSGPATTRTVQVTGKLRLNGDGTGTVDYKGLQITHQAVTPGWRPVSAYFSSCDVAYEDLTDGTYAMRFIGCVGTITEGGGAGGVATMSSDTAFSVTVSIDKSLLLLSDTEPYQEDMSFVIDSTTSFDSRICSRNYTATRQVPGR